MQNNSKKRLKKRRWKQLLQAKTDASLLGMDCALESSPTKYAFEERIWTIPAHKMKMRRDHIVPLADQAISILRDQETLTGNNRYVFSNIEYRDIPMSDNAVRRMGFKRDVITIHGFRATARTLLREKLKFDHEWIERQLAHEVKDMNGTAYNRTEYLEERTKMMEAWADYLNMIKKR